MRDATILRNILADMGYPQSATPIQTDNKCADGIAHGTVKSKRSKTFDMRYHWVGDRVRQNQFDVFWRKGGHKRADYFTKDHPVAHHKAMRHFFVTS
jgi:5-methylcytosine-specific restriction endonuclease McrA